MKLFYKILNNYIKSIDKKLMTNGQLRERSEQMTTNDSEANDKMQPVTRIH